MADKKQHILGPLSANEKGIFYSDGIPFIFCTGERNNLLEYNQQFDNAAWTKVRCSISADDAVAPDSTTTADKLVEDDTASNTHFIRQDFTPDGTSSYVIGCYLKAAGRTWAALGTSTAGFPNTTVVYYNLSTGTVGTENGSPDTTGIENIGNGWYFCWYTVTSNSAASTNLYVYLADADDSPTYNGDDSSGIYVWNAQVEIGTFPSALIPTINTNYFTYSQEFDHSDWTKGRSSITETNIISPASTQTASFLKEDDTGSDTHYVYQTPDITTGTDYVLSVYAKASTRNWLFLHLFTQAFPSSTQVYFNIATGEAGTVGGGAVSYGITDIGNGWYRCWLQGTSNNTAACNIRIHIASDNGVVSYNGDNSSGIYIWQAQLEIGTTPSDPVIYTKSLASAGARSESLAYWPNANIPQEFLNSKFSLEFIPLFDYDNVGALAQLLNYDSDNNLAFTTSDTLVLEETAITKVTASPQYVRGDKVQLICDKVGGSIEVRGATAGNQIYSGVPWEWPTSGSFYLGSESDKSEHFFGLVSPPQNHGFYDGVIARFENITFTNTSVRMIDVDEQVTNIPASIKGIRVVGGTRFLQSEIEIQNLFTYTQQFDHANWVKSNSSVTANDTTAPNNTDTADKLYEDGTDNLHATYQAGLSYADATTYTLSVYAKAAGRSWIRLRPSGNPFTGNPQAWFNVVSGAAGTAQDVDSSGIEYVGNGWYRCWLTATTTSADPSTTAYLYICTADGETTSYTGDGSSGFYIWNIQLEVNSVPSSPILCEASATTRNKDNSVINSISVPSRLRGKYTFIWIPNHDNTVGAQQYLYDFNESGSSHRVIVYYRDSDDIIRVYDVTDSQILFDSSALVFGRRQLIFVTIDFDAGAISIEGVTSGNGTTTGTSYITTLGDVYIGRTYAGTLHMSGLISEPFTPLFLFSDGTYTNTSPKYMCISRDVIPFAADIQPVYGYKGRLFYQSEQSVQNIFTYTQQIDHADWDKVRCTISANATNAPDGSLTADKIVCDSETNQTYYVEQLKTPDGSSSYCYSVYAKAAEKTWLHLYIHPNGFAGGGTALESYFDIENGTVGTTSASVVSSGIEAVDNGWYRCWMTGTSDEILQTGIRVYPAHADNDRDFDSDGTVGIYVWNPQVEIGSAPSSPILCEASATTRNDDEFYIASADVSAAFRKTVAFQFIPDFDSDQTTVNHCLIDFDELNDSSRITVRYNGTNDKIELLVDDSVEVSTDALTFSRGDIITVIIVPGSTEGKMIVLGTTSGDGTYKGIAFQTTEGDVYLGCLRDGTLQCSGKVSKPYPWK